MDAREKVLTAKLFPLKNIKASVINEALRRLAAIGLIGLYEIDEKPYLKVLKWSDHQRVRVSKHKYPEPTDEQLAAIRGDSRRVAASCGNLRPESNPIQSNPNPNPNPNTYPNPKENSPTESKRKTQPFITPTLEEIKKYCEERNNGIDPEYFFDYQEARGWTLKGGQKIKDWKAVIRTWERKQRESDNGYGRDRNDDGKTERKSKSKYPELDASIPVF